RSRTVKLFAATLFALALAAPASAGDVTVHCYGPEAAHPSFRIMLQSDDQFARRARTADIAIDPSGEATFVFRNVRPGRYSVAIMQGHGDWGWAQMRIDGRVEDPWLDIPFGGATFDMRLPGTDDPVRVQRARAEKLPENGVR